MSNVSPLSTSLQFFDLSYPGKWTRPRFSPDYHQGDGEVPPEPRQEVLPDPGLDLQPGVLVDQADVLQGDPDGDEEGETHAVVGVGRLAGVLDGEQAVGLVRREVGPEDLGEVLLQGRVDAPGGVDLGDGEVGGRLLGDEDVDAVGHALAGEEDDAEEQLVVRPDGGELEERENWRTCSVSRFGGRGNFSGVRLSRGNFNFSRRKCRELLKA